MKYRKLDKNGDYMFGNNGLDFISDTEAVAQAIKTKVMLFYQEWWEDISIGIPMFQSIIGKVADSNLKMTYTLLLTKRIQEIEQVTSVSNVEVKQGNRSLSFKIDVDTIYGSTSVEVEI